MWWFIGFVFMYIIEWPRKSNKSSKRDYSQTRTQLVLSTTDDNFYRSSAQKSYLYRKNWSIFKRAQGQYEFQDSIFDTFLFEYY